MKLNLSRLSFRVDGIVLLGSLLLLQGPNLVAFSLSPGLVRALRIICLLPFWLVIIKNLLLPPLLLTPGRLRLRSMSWGLLGLVVLCVGILALGYVRAYASGTLSLSESVRTALEWVTLPLFGLAIFLTPQPADEPDRLRKLIRCLFFAVGLYLSLNVLMHFSGLSIADRFSAAYTTELGLSRSLAILGVSQQRVLFPFAVGINAFGGIAGAALIIGAILVRFERSTLTRLSGALFAVCGLVAVLYVDSRVALASATLMIAIVWLLPRHLLRFAPLLPLVAPLFPLMLLAYTELIVGRLDQEIINQISRGGSEISNLNSRAYIWESFFDLLRIVDLPDLVGYGMLGQATSGIYHNYSAFFNGYAEPQQITLHNYALQYLIDTGFLGLLLVSALLVVALNRWQTLVGTTYDIEARTMLALISFLLLVGTTGVDLTPYHRETFLLTLLSICAAIPRHYQRLPVAAASSPAHAPDEPRLRGTIPL